MVSAKCVFRYESLKSKFSLVLLVYNVMIGCSKIIERIVREVLKKKEEERNTELI